MKRKFVRDIRNINTLSLRWKVNKVNIDGYELSTFLNNALKKVMNGILDPDINGKNPDKFIENLFKGRLGDFNNRYIISIYHENEIIGLLIALPNKENKLHIYSMGVIPAYRFKGVGTDLLEECSYDMKNIYDEISLDVHEDNYPAKNLYKKLGFVEA